jgi:hypothetical protein
LTLPPSRLQSKVSQSLTIDFEFLYLMTKLCRDWNLFPTGATNFLHLLNSSCNSWKENFSPQGQFTTIDIEVCTLGIESIMVESLTQVGDIISIAQTSVVR